MKLPTSAKMVATVALLGLAVQLGTSQHFYKSALLSLFFGVTLASVVLIHFRVRPSCQDALSVKEGGSGYRSPQNSRGCSPQAPFPSRSSEIP